MQTLPAAVMMNVTTAMDIRGAGDSYSLTQPGKSLVDMPDEILQRIVKLLDVNSKFAILCMSDRIHRVTKELLTKQKTLIIRQLVHPKLGLSPKSLRILEGNVVYCMDMCMKYLPNVIHFSIPPPFLVSDFKPILSYLDMISPQLLSLEYAVISIHGHLFLELNFPALRKFSTNSHTLNKLTERMPCLEFLTLRNKDKINEWEEILKYSSLKELRISNYWKAVHDLNRRGDVIRELTARDFVTSLLRGQSRTSLQLVELWNAGRRVQAYEDNELEKIRKERGSEPVVRLHEDILQDRYAVVDILPES
jgi:hypothetical protein